MSSSQVSSKASTYKRKFEKAQQAQRYTFKRSEFETHELITQVTKKNLMRNMSHLQADDEVNIQSEEDEQMDGHVEPEITTMTGAGASPKSTAEMTANRPPYIGRNHYLKGDSSNQQSKTSGPLPNYKSFKKNSIYQSFANAALRRRVKHNDLLPEVKQADPYTDHELSQSGTREKLIRSSMKLQV